MAQLAAFQLSGFVLQMYPEDHSPPHFHIIKDDWNIRIKFNLSIIQKDIVWDSKYPGNLSECPLKSDERKILLNLIKEHRKSLNKQWKELHPNTQGKKDDGSAQKASCDRSGTDGAKGSKKT